MASLFTRTFCIACEVLLMSFGFGLSLLIDRVERLLPGVVGIVGVVGVDGGDVAEVPPVTAVVIGDTVDIALPREKSDSGKREVEKRYLLISKNYDIYFKCFN